MSDEEDNYADPRPELLAHVEAGLPQLMCDCEAAAIAKRDEEAKELRSGIEKLLREMSASEDSDSSVSAIASARAAIEVTFGGSTPLNWCEGLGRRLYAKLDLWLNLYRLDLLIAGGNRPDYSTLESYALAGFFNFRNERDRPDSKPRML
jgi:hypothetical protein